MLLTEGKETVKKMQTNFDSEEIQTGGILTKENKIIELRTTNQDEFEILRESCLKKLTEICGRWKCGYWIEQTCKNMLDGMPEELYQNVWEWIEDKPISEIRIGELSIKELMKYTKVDFINCTKLMMSYIRRGCVDAIFFLNAYMRM